MKEKPLIPTSVYRLLAAQVAVAFLLASLVLLEFSWQVACSALLGGFVCVVANYCFARQSFRNRLWQTPSVQMKNFYLAEAYKICITIALMIVIFKFVHISAPAFFISYIANLSVLWCSPLILKPARVEG